MGFFFFKKKRGSRLTEDPANGHTFTDGNEILTGSGGAVKFGELENVNSSLQTGKLTRRTSSGVIGQIDFHIYVDDYCRENVNSNEPQHSPQ